RRVPNISIDPEKAFGVNGRVFRSHVIRMVAPLSSSSSPKTLCSQSYSFPMKLTTCSAGAIGSAPTVPSPNSSTEDWLPRANGNKHRGRQAHVVTRNLFLFNEYFGRLNYGKNIIALFEVHPL